MSRRYRFIYTRREGAKPFRGFAPLSTLIHIVDTGSYLGSDVLFIRGSNWNFDFALMRPRIDGREMSLSEMWYKAEWEKVDPSVVQPNA